MANNSKQDQIAQKPVNDYEKKRLWTVEQNKNKLRDLGVKNIANSFTSLVESKKSKKRIVKPANTITNDMDYIPEMDDDSEGDRRTSNKQHHPQYIAPMSMNKLANLAKQHRVIAPKVTKKFPLDSNPTKEDHSRPTVAIAKTNSSNKGSQRQMVLVDEDDDTFHEDVNEESMQLDGLQNNENEDDFIKAKEQFQELEQDEQPQLTDTGGRLQEGQHREMRGRTDTDFEIEKEIGNGMTSIKRGITCGKGARKVMKASKKRLPVEFNFQTRRVVSENESSFMYECGYILRNNYSLQYKEWRHVPNEVRLPLRHKLTTLFDIDVENSNICKVIDSYMARAWRGYRAKLHDHFKEIGGSENATKGKTTPPSNVSKEDWKYLCDMWCGTKYLQDGGNSKAPPPGRLRPHTPHLGTTGHNQTSQVAATKGQTWPARLQTQPTKLQLGQTRATPTIHVPR
ncbi:hypothetical protein E3N88_31665 [Mikania micrantha]|uniref:Uncharacterized protein n=1 Tax=Mikania micrantha TaxID=192012 RepID=A0A5N6M6V1_9ASTR|nr:hypothetical protein E3N88_31665 [Mikania micrantha]